MKKEGAEEVNAEYKTLMSDLNLVAAKQSGTGHGIWA